MGSQTPPLIKFPCEFPIKIIGLANAAFEIAALAIVRKHTPNIKENAIATRPSKDGTYLAMTITVPVNSQAELDALYLELTQHELILMVL